jgi:hypothetical protein
MTISSRIRSLALVACSVIALSLITFTPAQAASSHPINNWVNTSMCLGIRGGLSTPGTPAVLWHCNGNPDQQWHWGNAAVYNGIQYKQLVNGHGQCLGTNGGNIGLAVKLVSYTCYGSNHPDQYWVAPTYTNCGSGHFIYDAAAILDGSLLVIGTAGGNTSTNGTSIILWPFQDSCNDQMWYVPLVPVRLAASRPGEPRNIVSTWPTAQGRVQIVFWRRSVSAWNLSTHTCGCRGGTQTAMPWKGGGHRSAAAVLRACAMGTSTRSARPAARQASRSSSATTITPRATRTLRWPSGCPALR